MDKSIILLRTSTKQQDEQLQRPECIEYNLKKNWELAHVPFERQESAYKNEEGVWKEEIDWAIKKDIKHIIVWNMDRFSRLPEDRVLIDVKLLSTMHGIQIHAVHGDSWSEVVESIGKIQEMGFVGKALAEFLETLLKGLEFQRAHRESKVKSERVKLAVRKKETGTFSYKGNKWGRKGFPKQTVDRIIELHIKNPTWGVRKIASDKACYYYDKNNNQRKISKSCVHKLIVDFDKEKVSINNMSTIGLINGQ